MLPPMTTVVFCADAEMHDPTTPKMVATMMNHLLPNRSPNDPRTGPKAKVIKKLALAIQEAFLASPRLMTWKCMMVLVWLPRSVRNIKTFSKDLQHKTLYNWDWTDCISDGSTRIRHGQRHNSHQSPPAYMIITGRFIFWNMNSMTLLRYRCLRVRSLQWCLHREQSGRSGLRSDVLTVGVLRVVGWGKFHILYMDWEVCSTWSRNDRSPTPLIDSTRHYVCLPYTEFILDLDAALSGFMLHRRCWGMRRLALPKWLVCCTTENPGTSLGSHPIC